ncbi:MAG: transcriptional regulator [Pirellulales bacterium]
MSQSSRVAPATEDLPVEIADLGIILAQLPADIRIKLDPAYQQVVESTRRRRRILNLVQEALSQLRLDMKYLMFDLEATRRERDALQRQVEGNKENGEN